MKLGDVLARSVAKIHPRREIRSREIHKGSFFLHDAALNIFRKLLFYFNGHQVSRERMAEGRMERGMEVGRK